MLHVCSIYDGSDTENSKGCREANVAELLRHIPLQASAWWLTAALRPWSELLQPAALAVTKGARAAQAGKGFGMEHYWALV